MHSSEELRSSLFEVSVAGSEVRLLDLFEGFGEQDRLGVVMSRPFGALGASALITATITAFYDIQRSRAPEFFIYPDYYLFHVGGPLGRHGKLDVWPARKEVVVPTDPERILEEIDDRAITRLVVEDGDPSRPELEEEALASARGRIATCLAYSPSGRVRDADVRIASNPVAESYVGKALDSDQAGEFDTELKQRIRDSRLELVEDGVPVETYRRIELDEALGLLAPQQVAAS
jgi:hypothetical protein